MRMTKYLPDALASEMFYIKVFSYLKQKYNDEELFLKINGLYGSAKCLVLSKLFKDLQPLNHSLLVVTSTGKESEQLYSDIRAFADENVFYFPSWEVLPYENISPFYDIVNQRIEVLHHLVKKRRMLIITPVENLMRNIIPEDIFSSEYMEFKVDEDIDYKRLMMLLVELGYSSVAKVESPGEFSIKGSIIDIFPSNQVNPVRIELFGNTVESIRTFDVFTQKSIDKLNVCEILPQKEIIMTDDIVDNVKSFVNERFQNAKNFKQIMEYLDEKIYFQGIEQLLPFFYKPSSLLDYLSEDFIVVFNEFDKAIEKGQTILREAQSMYEQSHKHNIVKPEPYELFQDIENVVPLIKKRIDMTLHVREDEQEGVFNSTIGSPANYMGNIDLFNEEINTRLGEGYAIMLFAPYEAQAKRTREIVSNGNIISAIGEDKYFKTYVEKNNGTDKFSFSNVANIFVGVEDFESGFILNEAKVAVIMEREIFGRKRRTHKKIRKVNSSPIESFVDLRENDLVVHINHGIGQFTKIERMNINNKERDFIVLLYADDEKLYVPIEQLNLIQKYIGSSGKKAPLDRLGGKSWERTKERVRRSVEELAKELLELYATRQKIKGHAYPKDTAWQHDFEAEFEFEETPDQMVAIEEVKCDMESANPMDRLICGDVGYGKTEVAIRAAFKAVMDGKQVAVLTPTTILCEQHYHTFKSRFEKYPVKIEMLSRFRTSAQQKHTVKKLKEGNLDIIIGTHRLLSKDIRINNLGLVVVDEEQRFGVKHKERLKQMRNQVDVISMSATPIPRTLHMALTKIRNMSVINSPPENRLPIETFTMEFNDDIIRDAIIREVKRGGQVYFVFNRVKTIKQFASYIMKILPANVRVCVAHGQMEERELEEIIFKFIERKYDVLICTTIIESGIDIPNVNTILIDRADTFGLSQLYQLRGRVGRSSQQAYCYLFYPPDRALTEVAQRRLAVINEFTDLGSGFKIAMRDMEIRGAGNVLGPEQSGNIVNVGFDLYCKLLDEAITELSTGKKQIEYDTYVDLKYSGFIPDDYIPYQKQRIEIYKRIASCRSYEEIEDLKQEIEDRFGSIPEIVDTFLKISRLKVIGKELNVFSIVERGKTITILFDEHAKINPNRIMVIIKAYADIIKINPKNPNAMQVNITEYPLDMKVEKIYEILFHMKKN